MATRVERLDTLSAACDAISSHAHLPPASQLSRGFRFFVTSGSTDNRPEYVVKLAKTNRDDSGAGDIYRTALPSEATALQNLAVEVAMLTRLAETAVPVPAVNSHVTESGGDLPLHILMEHIDGTVLSETDDSLSMAQQRNMIEQLGHYLALVHETFSFDRLGELEVIDDEPRVLDGACC